MSRRLRAKTWDVAIGRGRKWHHYSIPSPGGRRPGTNVRHAMPCQGTGGHPLSPNPRLSKALNKKVFLIERERPIQVVLPLGSGPERRLVRDNDQLILIAQLLAC